MGQDIEVVGEPPAPETGTAEFIDAAAVAKRLGVCEGTVRNWTRSGELPCVKLGRSIRYHWGSVLEALLRLQRAAGQ